MHYSLNFFPLFFRSGKIRKKSHRRHTQYTVSKQTQKSGKTKCVRDSKSQVALSKQSVLEIRTRWRRRRRRRRGVKAHWTDSFTFLAPFRGTRTGLSITPWIKCGQTILLLDYHLTLKITLGTTVHSRFKKARFKKESRFKKDCCYNQFFSK